MLPFTIYCNCSNNLNVKFSLYDDGLTKTHQGNRIKREIFVCGVVSGSLHLDLLHGQVQEGVLVANADQALGALASHAGAQTAVQLHHHQLVEAGGHAVRQTPGCDLIVRLDL